MTRKTTQCTIPDCHSPIECKGLCWKHYMRLRRHGDPALTLHDPEQGCKVADCDKPHRTKGYCKSHHLTVYMPEFGRKCSVEGCNVGISARGLCANHYQQDERQLFNRLKEVALGKEPLDKDLQRSFDYVAKKALPKRHRA